jgi:hypothetical protein
MAIHVLMIAAVMTLATNGLTKTISMTLMTAAEKAKVLKRGAEPLRKKRIRQPTGEVPALCA